MKGLIEHQHNCGKNQLGRPIMFEEGDDDFVYFKNYKKTRRIPIVIYADFECILTPKKPDEFIQRFKYDIIPKELVKQFKVPRKVVIFRGENAAKKCMENMIDIGNNIKTIYETNIPMNKLTDNEENHFQRIKRCGICQLTKRYVKANIPNIEGLDYNSNEPITWITYLDCVNLYGNSMLTELPFKYFEWVDDLNIDITKIADDSKVGYILEVDIEYPKHLHKNHNDFPFLLFNECSTNMKVKKLLTIL
ncbi:hypothetical protein QTP88_017600 [Uroleucon formosanum]